MQELKSGDISPMQSEINHGLMVRWINQDIFVRAANDVRKSFVYYDKDKDFVFATVNELSEEGKKALEEASGVRYWSKGIV